MTGINMNGMGSNGVSPYANTYTYGNVKDENVSAKDKTADYYDYLQKKYDCVKNGNITMVAATTITSDTGGKGWKELQEERQEERLQEKKEAQARIDESLGTKEEKNEGADEYHKAIDISV